ncbi:hypothetical protein PGT21_023954 [Puccinia graminis f. sp. tritici]|uniref:Uncharacterized protein n=1 Tax=Puccinia graminis f. sp. tritici TaxID=56615 RepID=A0A5B0P8N1_PUCGR|nr:hypothetical protein PGT21_023954 [Puccinia graminis f. sp. tritici]
MSWITVQDMVKFLCVVSELGDGRIPTRIVHQSLFPLVEHCPKNRIFEVTEVGDRLALVEVVFVVQIEPRGPV